MLKHTEGQAIGDTTSSVIQGSMPGVDTDEIKRILSWQNKLQC